MPGPALGTFLTVSYRWGARSLGENWHHTASRDKSEIQTNCLAPELFSLYCIMPSLSNVEALSGGFLPLPANELLTQSCPLKLLSSSENLILQENLVLWFLFFSCGLLITLFPCQSWALIAQLSNCSQNDSPESIIQL